MRRLDGPAELWSLREDVHVELVPDDGPILLHSRWGDVAIERSTPVVREALRRMLLGPISLENVVASRRGPAVQQNANEAMAALRAVLDRLQPLIIRTLGFESGQPLLSVVPITPQARFHPEPLPADLRIQLSSFVQLRTDGNEYRLESPLSLHRVLLHRPEAVWLLGTLARPAPAVASANAWPSLGPLGADALAYLAAIGMVVGTEAAGDKPVIMESASLAGWTAVDLALHTRSNSGRHDSPLGRTYPMGEEGSPEPVIMSPRAELGIPLHRPEWDDLSAADPPLAVVMEGRRSERNYGTEPVTAEELGELLYRTARVRAVIVPPPVQGPGTVREPGTDQEPSGGQRDPRLSDRPYPAGGACYELELYLTVRECAGIPRGIYHYDPGRHRLELVNADHKMADQLLLSAAEATGIGALPPVLITMTARFQRLSWKYEGIAYATVLKDVGVMLQNLYLVCTAMGLAPCALGALNLDLSARALGTDWRLEPSVGQFMLGRAAEIPAGYKWRWEPVNDAEWADRARAWLRSNTTGHSGAGRSGAGARNPV
jgi:SagB-type dehydrogenase family enzyme